MTLKLNERILARLAELPKSEAPEPVQEVFVSLARTIMLGEDFKPIRARGGLNQRDAAAWRASLQPVE